PARLVAYDSDGRVIWVSDPLGWFDTGAGPGPARGRAATILRVTGANGAHAELLVGRSSDGGECVYVRHFLDSRHAGVSVSCGAHGTPQPPLAVSGGGAPPVFVYGRVGPGVAAVRIELAGGGHAEVRPRVGFVLWGAHAGQTATAAEALAANGAVLARPPLGRH